MILTPQSQLLERNISLFNTGSWAFINPSDAYFFDGIKSKHITVLHQYFDVFAECARVIPTVSFDSRDITNTGFEVTQKVSNHTHIFAPFVTLSKSHTDVMVFLPKAKTHFQMLLRMAAGMVGEGGRIHVVGENKGGIKSAAKLMQQYGPTQKVDSARHCSLVTVLVESDHLAFDPADWVDFNSYSVDGCTWDIASMPGVFSYKELDTGTELLLEKLSTTLSGDVLDFACGAGVIASYVMLKYPHLKLHLTDVSALAVYCSALTLAKNNLTATLYAADGLHGFTKKVQHILTNPPFHTGIKTDYTVTKRFISDAKKLLTSQGSMQMVANRFLPYPGLLAEHFQTVYTTAQTSQFSVYQATF
ncbi:MAG: methyltransferase [Pseudomonadota bacterium]|jgi:16S rRNA (guanine1207-N2)-methyltransferase|nr:methyltransferase [Pseudomonadota bacterium]